MRLAIGIALGLVSACGSRPASPSPSAAKTPAPSPAPQFHPEIARFDATTQTVQRAVAEAKAGRAQTFVFDVSTSIGYGCDCPPFVLGSGEDDTFVMPAFGELPDPEEHYLLGQYRMLGRFDGRTITAIQWKREAGEKHVAGESDAGWDEPQPAIVVDDWCFEPRWDSLESWKPRDWVVRELRSLRELGRICPGTLPRENELVAAVLAPPTD